VAAIRDDAISAAPGSTVAAVAWSFRGQMYVTVIAKATFAFAFDADMPRVEPQEIVRADVHEQKNPARSARVTSDLAPYLPFVDVVFTGHAHAGGGLVRVLPVRLTVVDGEETVLDKRLLVQDAAGFERMPIVYERASGGPGAADNPAGVDRARGAGEPNVIDPEEPRRPAGFGPVGRAWPSRKRLLGRTARKFLDAEVAQIPDDFEWSYYQVAPPDQQAERMSGGAWIMLEGLCPACPLARMRLPDVSGFAFVYGAGAGGEMLELALDTVRLDGDEERCTVLLRGSLPVEDEAALGRLRIVAGVGSAGAPLTWPVGAEEPSGVSLEDEPELMAGFEDESPLLRTIPFVAEPPPQPALERSVDVDIEAPRSRRIPFPGSFDTADLEVDQQLHLAIRPAVPFRRSSSTAAMRAVRPSPPSVPPPSTGTLVLAREEPAAPPPAPPPEPEPEEKEPPRREAIVAPSLDTGPARPAPSPRKAPPASLPVGPPTASPALKRGLYGKYGGKP
jgi:hypothetical protein